MPDLLDDPTPNCPVCSGQGNVYLTINTAKTSLDLLLRRVLKQELGLNEPILDTGGNLIECLTSFEDAEEKKQLDNLLTKNLSDKSVGLTDGTSVEIADETQGDVKLTLMITHR